MERQIVYNPNLPHLGGNIRGGDEMTYFPEMWDFLIEKYHPKSICDVGCGEGYLMKYFHDKGIAVHGIDGMQENKDNAPAEVREQITVHDYTLSTGPVTQVDMSLSVEFVEHVEEENMSFYTPQLCACKTLVFTHALPGQPGHHHVHCTDDAFWIQLMEIFNFRLSLFNCQARKLAKEKGKVLYESILIFERNER